MKSKKNGTFGSRWGARQRKLKVIHDPEKGEQSRGFALPLVLTVIGCLLLMWAAFFSLAQTSVRLVRLETARRQAYWSARAGALHGLAYAVARNDPFTLRTAHLASSDKTVDYNVTINHLGNYVDIRSVGASHSQEIVRNWHALIAHSHGNGHGGSRLPSRSF